MTATQEVQEANRGEIVKYSIRSEGRYKGTDNLPRNSREIIRADAVTIGGLLGFGFAYIVSIINPTSLNCSLLFICLTALPMLLLEVVYYRSYRRLCKKDKSTPSRLVCNWRRCWIKCLGLAVTLVSLILIYLLLPEYNAPFYRIFKEIAVSVLPFILFAGVPYIIWVDSRLTNPNDDCFEFGRIFCGEWREVNWIMASNHIRAWGVKGFFLPLMIAFSYSQVNRLLLTPLDIGAFPSLFIFLTTLFFTVDVIFGTVGYLFTFKILDTQIRSVEPTLLGWIVTLLC
jgi:hypothetical protein